MARQVRLTGASPLGTMILAMISTSALAAFTPAIDRSEPPRPVRGVQPTQGVEASPVSATAQRTLEAVPAQPNRPTPRGSLLDLRV
jgi:hypothetical protein